MDENKGERREDQVLVAFTDTLLEGREMDAEDRPPLADTVETLARELGPRQPPAGLRRRVRQCIVKEWGQRQKPLLRRLSESLGSLGRPRHRWAWATITALIVTAAAAALILPKGPFELSGTAAGDVGIAALATLLVLASVLVVAWFARRR
jgi:hypothetical protein